MKIENLEEVLTQLKGRLHDYLRLHGREPTKLFRCINPEHEDKHPSCSATGGDGTLFRCMSGCSAAGDIFHAAHHLEGKPLLGEEFIRENVAYLADKFDIEIKEIPLSEEELYRIETYRAYASAASLINVDNLSDVVSKDVERRGWDKEICSTYGVGSVPSFKDFRTSLRGLGFTAAFLDDVDLGRESIFSEQNLTFTIRDPKGRPVGFSSRTFNGGPNKYNNQRTTGLKCNIYKKSTRLFGLDVYLARRKKNEFVYIFEGYSDVITAAGAGVNNCVAIGSSDLSVEQLQVLKDNNIYKIIICLDGDSTGREKTAKTLDTILSGHKDLSVKVIVLPDGTDPDQLIREKGITVFRRLKKWTAFEWRLNEFATDADEEEICQTMVPLIVNESSHIAQDKMCKVLATRTGVDLRVVRLEVERLQNSREAEKQRHRDRVINKLIQGLQRHPQEAEQIIFNARGELENVIKQYEEDTMSEDYFVSAITKQKDAEEAKTSADAGFVLGDDLKALEQIFWTGEWSDTWWVVAADEQAGKTALMLRLCIAAVQNKKNNAMVIIHSIDDTREQILPRCVAILAGDKAISINQVINPSLYADRANYEQILQLREKGYADLLKYAREGRIVIRDDNDGNTLAYADRLIKEYKSKYPDRKMIYVLDNFHKLDEFKDSNSDDRNKCKRTSEQTKRLATSNHITVMSTVEYRKGANAQVIKNRGNEDVAETKGISYDGSVIIHLYNDMHVNGDTTKFFHVCTDPETGEARRMPVVRVGIKKNKVSGFETTCYINFHTSSSDWSFTDGQMTTTEEEEEDKGSSWNMFK